MTAGRTITTIDIVNNPTSVPPLSILFNPAVSKMTRGTPFLGTFQGDGGTGGYTFAATGLPQCASFSGSCVGTVLTISSIVGAVAIGSEVRGAGVTAGMRIVSFGTGTGGNGTYNVSVAQTITVAMTAGVPINAATGAVGSATGPLPTVIGPVTVTVTVTDSGTNTFTTTFVFNIQSRLYVQQIPNPGESSVTYLGGAQPLNKAIIIGGGTGTISFPPGGVVDGCTISTAGLFGSGPPTNPGSFTVNTTATDSGTGDTLAVSFVWVVHPKIAFSAGATQSVTTDTPFALIYPITNGWPPGVGVSGVSKPSWMTITVVQATVSTDGNSLSADAYLILSGTPPSSTYKAAATTGTIASGNISHGTGGSASFNIPLTIVNPAAIQPQLNGANVGGSFASLNKNFVGGAS
jgi:hypothetical protein